MEELYPVIPGTVIEECTGYWGPHHTRYNTVTGSTLTEGQSVNVLWQEGDYYYVKYTAGGVEKRSYFEAACIETPSGMAVTTHTPPAETFANCRFVRADAAAYPLTDVNVLYAPGSNASVAGSLSTFEKVYFVATVNGYSLVDYALTGSSGKRKRAWIANSKIGAIPDPTGEIYIRFEGNGNAENKVAANAQYFYNCFIALGFSPQAACGILGNIKQECSMDPALWEVQTKVINGVSTSVDVYGLFQWTPAINYLNRAVQQGIISAATEDAIKAFENNAQNRKTMVLSQIECMIWQSLENYDWGDPEAYNYVHHREDEKVMAFREFAVSTDNAGLLALTFLDHFERAGNPHENLRVQYANEYYNTFA